MNRPRLVRVKARRTTAFAGAVRLVVAVGVVVGVGGGALHGWETWVRGAPGGVAGLVLFFLVINWRWLLLATSLCGGVVAWKDGVVAGIGAVLVLPLVFAGLVFGGMLAGSAVGEWGARRRGVVMESGGDVLAEMREAVISTQEEELKDASRRWNLVDTKGTTINARVLAGEADAVMLDKDGVVYTVPIEKLSAVSRKLVAEILMARRGQ